MKAYCEYMGRLRELENKQLVGVICGLRNKLHDLEVKDSIASCRASHQGMRQRLQDVALSHLEHSCTTSR
jgi:hypothetical protein